MVAKSEPKKASKKTSASPSIEPRPESKPLILGVDLKGELLDVELTKVIDPAGTPDRLARDGDEVAIENLARSMRETGQLQPVMLERLVDGRFARVFGRRRIAAARKLGWTHIRASVVPPLPDNVRRTIVAVENVQRQDLTPAEETLAVAELMELQAISAAVQYGRPLSLHCGAWGNVICTPDTTRAIAEMPAKQQAANRRDLLLDHNVRNIAAELVAAMLGKAASWVRDRMYIGRLDQDGRKAVLDGRLPLAHAREIAKVSDDGLRKRLAKDYAAGGSDSISRTEPGKLSELQDEVRKHVFALWTAPWNPEIEFAGKSACTGCQFNSTTNPGLFEVGGKVSLSMIGGRGTWDAGDADAVKVREGGVCTLPSCYQEKLRAAKGAISTHAKRIVELEISAKKAKGGKQWKIAGVSPKDSAQAVLAAAKDRVPEYVKDSALAKKIEDRRKLGSPSRPKVHSDPKAKERAELAEAKSQASYKLRDARMVRVKKLETAIIDSLKTKPGSLALMHLVVETGPWKKGMGKGPTARKAAHGPELQQLLRLVKSPSLEGLIKIEKAGGFKFGLLDPWNMNDKELVDVVATAMGIDLGNAPTLEQFLPAKFRTAKKAAAVEFEKAAEAGEEPDDDLRDHDDDTVEEDDE